MSVNRKSSFKCDRTYDFSEGLKRPGSSRQRKHSVNLAPHNLEDLPSQLAMHLDDRLTTKLVFIKRLEKLEKEAIRLFYDGKHESCFEQLSRGVEMLEERKLGSQATGGGLYSPLSVELGSEEQSFSFYQHQLYIRYLQTEFSFKMKNYQAARQYYEKATKIITKSRKIQREKSAEYINSLSVLNASLLFEQGKTAESIKAIEAIEYNLQGKLSAKVQKSLKIYKVQCLVALHSYDKAKKLIETLLESSACELSEREEGKIVGILANIQKSMGCLEESEKTMEQFIKKLKAGSAQLEGGEQSRQHLLSKCYCIFAEICWQDPIKALYVCRRWAAECEYPDLANVKLFHLYFLIGDYEQALTEYAEISDAYKRTSEDWEVLSKIKLFYGEKDSAEFMLQKAFELAKDDTSKLLLEIEIVKLNYAFLENKKDRLRSIDKKIRQLASKQGEKNQIRVGDVRQAIGEYRDFLLSIGEGSRAAKVGKYMQEGSELQETGKFGNENFSNLTSPLRSIQNTVELGQAKRNDKLRLR